MVGKTFERAKKHGLSDVTFKSPNFDTNVDIIMETLLASHWLKSSTTIYHTTLP